MVKVSLQNIAHKYQNTKGFPKNINAHILTCLCLLQMPCQPLWQIYIHPSSSTSASNLTGCISILCAFRTCPIYKVLAAPVPLLRTVMSTVKTYDKCMHLCAHVFIQKYFYINNSPLHNVHSYILICMYLRLLIAKEHIQTLLQFLADLIPPYWQTLEFS